MPPRVSSSPGDRYATSMYAPSPLGSVIFHPVRSILIRQVPAGASPASAAVNSRVQPVSLSSDGGFGAATTLAKVVVVARRPSFPVTRAANWCLPGVSHDVTSQLPSSPYVYGASFSVQRTFPSMENMTDATCDAGTDGRATQWIRCGSIFFPSMVVVIFSGALPPEAKAGSAAAAIAAMSANLPMALLLLVRAGRTCPRKPNAVSCSESSSRPAF